MPVHSPGAEVYTAAPGIPAAAVSVRCTWCGMDGPAKDVIGLTPAGPHSLPTAGPATSTSCEDDGAVWTTVPTGTMARNDTGGHPVGASPGRYFTVL